MPGAHRGDEGQAAVEYVAACLLVAAVLAAAAALTSGGVGDRLAYAIRRGVCAVSGESCPAPPRDRADLPPCPLARSVSNEAFHVAVAFFRVGGGLGVLEERSSDGRVAVTFTNAGSSGVTAGVGAHMELGAARAGAELAGYAEVAFTAGRTWRLPSQAAADDFVRRYGSDQSLLGRLGNDARRICLACQLLGWEPATPPDPDETFLEGGGAAEGSATAGLGARAEARAALAGAIGRRRTRSGSTTWYLQLDGALAARVYAALGLGATGGASGLAELTSDARGQLVSLTLRFVRRWAGESAIPRAGMPGVGGDGLRADLPPFAARGAVLESEVRLDLTESGGRAAVLGVLESPTPAAVARLSRALRERGVASLRSYRARGTHRSFEGEVAAGPAAGGGYDRDSHQLDLEGVYTRLPGLGYLPRADCLAM